MQTKEPIRAVDIANELGKDKRTILNWLKSAYENKTGVFAGLRIRKEDFNGNTTYLIEPEDWEQFKEIRTVGNPANTHETVLENEPAKQKPYASAPPPSHTNTEVSQLVSYLREKDERMYEMVARAAAAEAQLKLLTDGRSELEQSYETLRNSHYAAQAKIKELEASLENNKVESTSRSWWKFWQSPQ
jgi:hypothetical protein